jgi:hypothetical protein
MNSFADWRSGSTLGDVFKSVSGNGNKTTNHGSLEDALKTILGESYGKTEVPTEAVENLQDAQRRAEELTKATDAITKMAEELERKIEETKKEEPAKVSEELIEEEQVVEQVSKAYRVFRDRDETFECKISIQGAGLSAAQVRIIFDTDFWNFTFYGKLYKDGKCLVPIKKGIPLEEGTRGRARLEVIVDEQLFVPWEDEFVVEGSKKVKVELKEQRSVSVSINSNSSHG